MIKQAYFRGLTKIALGQYNTNWGVLDYLKHFAWDNPLGVLDSKINPQTGLTWGQTRRIATDDYLFNRTPEELKRFKEWEYERALVDNDIDQRIKSLQAKTGPSAPAPAPAPAAKPAPAPAVRPAPALAAKPAPAPRQAPPAAAPAAPSTSQSELQRLQKERLQLQTAMFEGNLKGSEAQQARTRIRQLQAQIRQVQRQQRDAMRARNRVGSTKGRMVAGQSALQRHRVNQAMNKTTKRLNRGQAAAAQSYKQLAADAVAAQSSPKPAVGGTVTWRKPSSKGKAYQNAYEQRVRKNKQYVNRAITSTGRTARGTTQTM